eukprot:4129352-Prymnesium_polylepis.1
MLVLRNRDGVSNGCRRIRHGPVAQSAGAAAVSNRPMARQPAKRVRRTVLTVGPITDFCVDLRSQR